MPPHSAEFSLLACLLSLLIYPEDGYSISLRDVGEFLSDYTASHSRRLCISYIINVRPLCYKPEGRGFDSW
jgi:hypothetical protein